VGEKGASVSTKKTPVHKKTITVQVIEALTSPEVLGKIIPILSDKISESITCVIRVNDMTSIVYGYINVMESKTGPPGILFLVFKTDF
jgi:hypothetical protein